MSEGQQNAAQVIQALEDQMRLLRQDIQSLKRSSLNSEEADALNQRIVSALKGMEKKADETGESIKDYSRAVYQLTKEATEKAVNAELADIKKELQNSNAELAAATKDVHDTTWLKRVYLGIAGATFVGLLLVLGSYFLTNRSLNAETRQAELARLDQAISNNKVEIERQKFEYNQTREKFTSLNQNAEALSRFYESIDYTNALGGGVELYLKEGWGTERCELANGSRVNKCIRRD